MPEDVGIYEILAILFTEEEARLAAKMPVAPANLQNLLQISDLPVNKLKRTLTRMMDKGLILDQKRRVNPGICYSMALVGFFEFTFMHLKQTSLPLGELAKLIRSYRLGNIRYFKSNVLK